MSSGIKSAIDTLERAIMADEKMIAMIDEGAFTGVDAEAVALSRGIYIKEIGEHKAALAILVTIDIATGENHA